MCLTQSFKITFNEGCKNCLYLYSASTATFIAVLLQENITVSPPISPRKNDQKINVMRGEGGGSTDAGNKFV